jgi:hypothetical protein
MEVRAGGTSEAKKVVGSMSLVLVKDKVLFLYAYRSYSGEQPVKELKTFTSDWVRSLMKVSE